MPWADVFGLLFLVAGVVTVFASLHGAGMPPALRTRAPCSAGLSVGPSVSG